MNRDVRRLVKRAGGDISAAHDEAAEILGDLMEPEGELHD